MSFSEEQRSRFITIVNDFLSEKRIPASTSKQRLARHLRNLRKHAKELAEDLDPPSLARVDALWFAARHMPSSFFENGVATLHHQCDRLVKAASQALENLPAGSPGRPRINAEERLIRDLHALYLDAGGEGTGAYHHVRRDGLESEEGRFLNFVFILLTDIRLPMKRNTLGRTIRRVLSS